MVVLSSKYVTAKYVTKVDLQKSDDVTKAGIRILRPDQNLQYNPRNITNVHHLIRFFELTSAPPPPSPPKYQM